jgi:hypothetical protein
LIGHGLYKHLAAKTTKKWRFVHVTFLAAIVVGNALQLAVFILEGNIGQGKWQQTNEHYFYLF